MNRTLSSIAFLVFILTDFLFADSAEKPKPAPKATFATFYVADRRTDLPIADVEVSVYDLKDSILFKKSNSQAGICEFELPEGVQYRLRFKNVRVGHDRAYFALTQSFSKKAGNTVDTIYMQELIGCRGCFRIQNLHYASNSVFPTDSVKSFHLMNLLDTLLIENPTMVIEIDGHSDCRGSAQGNLRMSQKRAQLVADYLIKKGISKNRIEVAGYGDTRPVNACNCHADGKVICTEEEYLENRRVEFRILRM